MPIADAIAEAVARDRGSAGDLVPERRVALRDTGLAEVVLPVCARST